MTDPNHDLDELTARLRRERPDMSDDAFARVHDRVVAQAPQRRRTPRTSIATALLIATGLVFTGGGVSLAVSGLASDTTAVKAQYQPPVGNPPPPPAPPGTTTTGATPPPGTTTGTTPPTGVQPGVSIQGGTATSPAPTPTTTTDDGDDVGVQGETDTNPDPSLGGSAGEQDQQPVQSAPQQVVASSGGDELPFTGFAAIPIVVIGAVLIAAGALLRRRTQP